MRTMILNTLAVVALGAVSSVLAQDIPEEARRHMVRGRAAVEMARAPEQYRLAIVEFEQAVRLAPHWADAHYNLASVRAKAGDTGSAIQGFRRYLELAPAAADAGRVRDEIIRLEYQLEVQQTATALAGKWSPGVQIGVKGTEIEVIASNTVTYRGMISGDLITGTRIRKAYGTWDNCDVPEDRGTFRAQISPDRNTIDVTFEYTDYKTDSRINMGQIVANTLNLFATSEDTRKEMTCTGVTAVGTRTGAETWYRPGTIGVALADAGRVQRVAPGGPAELAGLRAGDRIAAVDGKPVSKEAKSWQVGGLLSGPAGRPLTLVIERAGAAEPVELKVTRRPGEPPSEESRGLSATSSGCFIATAAYGSYLDPHVQALREFRDRWLLTNAPGRAFVRIYYRVSPPVADAIAASDGLRAAVRAVLAPVVYALRYPLGTLGLAAFALFVMLAGRRARRSRV